MKITDLETLHVDGGFSTFSYLKLSTDAGLTGWSEFSRHETVDGVIHSLRNQLVGSDPTNVAALDALFQSINRRGPGGIFPRAAGAVMNACLDIKGKEAGLPVYELLGGAIRDAIPVYWSHLGLFRAHYSQFYDGKAIDRPAVRSLDDLQDTVREAVASGYKAIKSNIIRFDATRRTTHLRGLNRPLRPGYPELNASPAQIAAFADQLAAMREAGPELEIMFDLNYHFRPEGMRRFARAAEPYALGWLEVDLPDAAALAAIRQATATPIGSLEQIMGARGLRPFLDAEAVDVAIVDPQWVGIFEAVKMARIADVYDVNVAAHCSGGPLGARIAAHYCAAIPNLRIMEHEGDMLPWAHDLLTVRNHVEDGLFHLPFGPGWGADVDEDVARAHPAKSKPDIR
ncbi:MAG TPA: mandelate racemase/muconate lactonizing enzyme family protein [Allosphingosinicella sp.]|nr:mandelate racemase/muconate lactonizing enzyme family protein [Allosphingosinicella sp.]